MVRRRWRPGMADPVFRRLAVIGVGLIGSSVLRACRERPGLAGTVVATDSSPAVLQRVAELGIADGWRRTWPARCRARIASCCARPSAPSRRWPPRSRRIWRRARGDGHRVHQAIGDPRPGAALPRDVHLVPAHPMAGTEFSGPDAGFATLFDGRWCLLTPLPGRDAAAVERVAALWRGMGATIEIMEPGHHDRVVAIVSHLPHLIAFTICGTADDLADESRQQVMRFAAAGFRDFTRIAASDPVMWRDVFLNNREALLEMLARFTEDAQAMARAVRWGDGAYIADKIERGRAIRRSLIELKQA